MATRDTKVLRISEDLHGEAKTLAEKRRTTLTAFAEEAIRQYIDALSYNPSILMNLVEKNPSLVLSREIIEENFSDAPVTFLKEIINEIEDSNKQVIFRKLTYSEDFEINLKNLVKEDLCKIVATVKINDSPEMQEIANKIPFDFQNVVRRKCQISLALKMDERVEANPEILLFLSIKRGDNDGDTS